MQSGEECEEYMCSLRLKQLEQSSKQRHPRTSSMGSQVKGKDSQQKFHFQFFFFFVLITNSGMRTPTQIILGGKIASTFKVIRAECSYPSGLVYLLAQNSWKARK